MAEQKAVFSAFLTKFPKKAAQGDADAAGNQILATLEAGETEVAKLFEVTPFDYKQGAHALDELQSKGWIDIHESEGRDFAAITDSGRTHAAED